MTPKATVIIPVHNGAKYIGAALRSVTSQTFRDFEVIVIDDGSTDETVDVVAEIDDPRVRVYSQPNRGLSAARNRGVEEATGTILAFLDADDEWSPEKLELQFQAVAPGRLVYSDILFWEESTGRVLGTYEVFDRFPHDREKFSGDVLPALLAQNFVHPSTVVIRKQDLEKVGPFDEGLPVVEDWDLWLRCAEHLRFQRIDSPLVRVRRRDDSLQRRTTDMVRAGAQVLDRARERLERAGPLDDEARFMLGVGYLTVRAMSDARRMLLSSLLRHPSSAARWRSATAAVMRPWLKGS